jgi:hypothetical protein
MAHLDPELEHFKRTLDLVAYAKKAGYEPRPEPVGFGLTVLDCPGRERIAIAQAPSGVWIYALVSDYQHRGAHESEAHALARLRGCVLGSRDKGTIVEFVLGRDAAARSAEVPLDRVRERLRAFRDRRAWARPGRASGAIPGSALRSRARSRRGRGARPAGGTQAASLRLVASGPERAERNGCGSAAPALA